MAEVENGVTTPYDEAMDALSSLITKRSRADKSSKGGRFDLLFDYLKILELDEAVAKMKIVHVAGTKGKGSTCTFTESILRNCGFRTGLFTSPHLIDIRERFRLNGEDICKEKFLSYFWWCYHKLKENVTEDVPMPTFFHFIALLAFKIFADEQVDVVILEVGLGGRFDATNVVQAPVVCGIASLGYDHMEILGNTLGQIAGEKAGIFKEGVPAFTVGQPEEAMCVLEQKAAKLNVDLQVAPPLDAKLLSGQKLGLEGDHQYVNAGLAIALSSLWLQRTGHHDAINLGETGVLPQEFVRGLTMASMQGRAQIVHDQSADTDSHGDLMFYLDGAHSPESMDVCAKWFSLAIKGAYQNGDFNNSLKGDLVSERQLVQSHLDKSPRQNLMRILLFNCMSVRDPQVLLPRLVNSCANHGVHFNKALFVPNMSVYNKVGAPTSVMNDPQVDLSWQFSIQKIWENLVQGSNGGEAKNINAPCQLVKDSAGMTMWTCENSIVFPSLPLAIKWLRDRAQQNRALQLQVLVTGSLHLVGDVLRLIKK